jgi:hypothetical protein
MMPGSFNCTSAECPTFVGIRPGLVGSTIVVLAMPDPPVNISGGVTMNFSIDVLPGANNNCPTITASAELTQTITGLSCPTEPGGVCSMAKVQLGSGDVILELSQPELTISTPLACRNTDGTINVSATLDISTQALEAGESVTINYYCADALGNPMGAPVASEVLNGPLAMGSVNPIGLNLSGCALNYGLVIEATGSCACAAVRTQVDIEYLINSFPDEQSVCEGVTPVDILFETGNTVANGIQFVYFTGAAAADPYSGGTVIGTGTGDGAEVTLSGASLPTAPGEYFIYAILNPTPGSAGCRPWALARLTVVMEPDPIELCAGQTYTLTAPGMFTNVEWFRNGVSVGTSNTYIVTLPGVYTFEAEDGDGCSAISCCSMVFEQGDCMSVGSTVWYDTNDNGIYDQSSENPIPGVTVQLYTAGGTLVATDVTDSNGDYYFGNLLAGMYYIQIPGTAMNLALSGLVSSTITNTTGGVDNNDNGEQPGGIGTVVTSETFTLVPDMEPVGAAEVGTGGIQDDGPAPAGFPDTNTDDDGNMTIDFGFAPAPMITHDKSFVSAVQQANGSYNVTYTITVNNQGAASSYNLTDTPNFDDDIAINSATYSTTNVIPAVVGAALSSTNAMTNILANDVVIGAGVSHIYTLSYNVTLNLAPASPGNNVYTACGSGTPGNPAPGEGLYNMTALDTNDDGTPEETDEVCGDLPYITHRKDAVTVSNVPNADGTYTVVYTVVVQNLGGESGTYDLTDTPTFDDDIVITEASYSTVNVVPAVGGGALSLINGQPNTLADDIVIPAGITQTYTLTYRVILDLSPISTDGGDNLYTSCGNTNNTLGPVSPDGSTPGQGLYNATVLDTNNDGTPEERDEICADLPYITHEKTGPVISAQQPNGSYNVTYTVTVRNLGGASGDYDLFDTPTFDDDIAINTASFTSTNPPNLSGPLSTTNGSTNTLAGDVNIAAGGVHTYTLAYNVTLNLAPASPGNNVYTACGSGTPGNSAPGEGLYNMTALDLNDDGTPEETDEVCGDLPYITHEKSGPVISAQQPNGSYNVTYTVVVTNTGGTSGDYDLFDTPTFDDDIAINTASFTSTNPPNLSGPLSTTNGATNTLAGDVIIAAGGVHTYTLSFNVTLNLAPASPGNNVYTACGSGTPGNPAPGEGLYNMTALDLNDDGTPEETDEVCGDLPYITHRKDAVTVSNVPNADGTYTVVYTVVVQNLGGESGTYDLTDTPTFDDDIVITEASYSTVNVVPAVGGGALSLINGQPNTLADDIVIPAGITQTYTLTYRVILDLSPISTDGGDNLYTSCGNTNNTLGPVSPDGSTPGQGLYNATVLDTNNDGTPEERDEICADLPYITHEKTGPVISAQQPNGSYNVTYTVTVRNLGGASGDYDLFDTPTFDDDIAINTASFTSTNPPNLSGPLSTTNGATNTLAGDVIIAAGGVHTYTLSFNVTLNLAPASPGNNVYTACGSGTPGNPAPGEGLYNMTALDLNDDGTPEETDEVCGDLPYITHEKTGPVISAQQPNGSYNVTYTVTVRNLGGASGDYDLFDTPTFDDDIAINTASFTSTNPPNLSGPLSTTNGATNTLAGDVIIAAGGVHTYTLSFNVTLNLAPGISGQQRVHRLRLRHAGQSCSGRRPVQHDGA